MSEVTDKSMFSKEDERSLPQRYGYAILLVLLAWSVREVLAPVLPGETRFLYFVPSVLVAAWIGGLGPGMFATALSIASSFLIADAPPVTSATFINFAAFTIIGIGVSWGGELLHRSQRSTKMM